MRGGNGDYNMSKTSLHFKESEFGCKHCGTTEGLSTELIAVLELVRYKFGSPVIVTSAVRCKVHNTNVGGAKRSKHLEGTAADIKVKGVSPKDVYDFLNETFPNYYGLGLYNTFTHVDVRSVKARWGKGV